MGIVFSQKKKNRNTTAGFSLIELLVTIGIIVLVTSAAMVKYSAFDSVTLLKSQAIEVALDVRTAQQYGVNVRAEGGADRTAYGIYFDTGNPNEYFLFSDTNDNNIYNSGEAIGGAFTIDDRFYIKDICLNGSCGSSVVSIAFKRPNFDAIISGGGSTARIVLGSRSNSSAERDVVVYSSGQVTTD